MERSLPESISKIIERLGIEAEGGANIPQECWRCKIWLNPMFVARCPVYQERGECPWLDDALRLERERLEAIGVPERVIRILYDDLDRDTEALKGIREHLRHVIGGGALLIFGGVGVGKSVAMGWFFRAAIRLSPASSMRFIEARDINWKKADKLKVVDFLGIDDLGLEHDPEIVKAVFEYRYAWQKATVATSNLTAEQFRKRYGERVRDRLREWGKYVVVRGESMR